MIEVSWIRFYKLEGGTSLAERHPKAKFRSTYPSNYFNRGSNMWWRRLIRPVHAQEEEVVDPQAVLREKCGKNPKIMDLKDLLETCNARVRGKKHTEETCLEELMDYLHEMDHCVSHDLFKHLK